MDLASLQVRPLEEGDFDKGYLQLLAQMTVVGDVSREMFEHALEKLGDDHRVVVIEDGRTGKVIATGTLLIEQKFARNCGKVGHVEDIVVDDTMRGRHLGQRIVEELTSLAKAAGCYKVILDCKEENARFYEKCGYSRKEIQMAKYF